MNARSDSLAANHWAAPKAERRHPPAGSALLSEKDWAEAARALRLSGRELQIVRGVFDNCTEHAIAADQGIANCTVHTHLERLYHKLAVTTRVELVLLVMDTFLHPKPPPPSSNGTLPTTVTASAPDTGGVL